MNNKQYWIDRENQKLNKGIKDCNKIAKELQFILGFQEIFEIFKRF